MNWDDLYSGLKVFANRAAIKINQSADIATLQVKLSMAERKLEETFAPTMLAARIGSEGYTALMDKERERLKAGEKSARRINTLVTRFLYEDDDESFDPDAICDPKDHPRLGTAPGRGAEYEHKGAFKLFIDDVMERIRTKLGKQ
jgi:hypothetical protein